MIIHTGWLASFGERRKRGAIGALHGRSAACAQRRLVRVRRTKLVIALLGAFAVAASPAIGARPATYAEVLKQISSGPVIRAIINRTRGDIEIKFRDLSEWEAFYPPGAQPRLQRLLRERHIRTLFAARPRPAHRKAGPVHHHLRYIAAGVAGVLAVIGLILYVYSRGRPASRPPGADPPAQSSP